MDWTLLISPVAGLVDSLIYTPQEQAADQLAAGAAAAQLAAAEAQRQSALAGLAAADTNAKTMRFVAILGAGVVGAGLLVWSMRA